MIYVVLSRIDTYTLTGLHLVDPLSLSAWRSLVLWLRLPLPKRAPALPVLRRRSLYTNHRLLQLLQQPKQSPAKEALRQRKRSKLDSRLVPVRIKANSNEIGVNHKPRLYVVTVIYTAVQAVITLQHPK